MSFRPAPKLPVKDGQVVTVPAARREVLVRESGGQDGCCWLEADLPRVRLRQLSLPMLPPGRRTALQRRTKPLAR